MTAQSPSPHRPDDLVNQIVPPEFFAHSLRVVQACYPASYAETYERFPKEEAHDLLGHVRRAAIESNWRKMARRHPAVAATVQRNRMFTSYFTIARCGNVAMTVNAVAQPCTIVRDAAFRTTLAEDNQGHLEYPGMKPKKKPTAGTAPLYAILLHGENPARPAEIGFAHVVFPLMGSEGKIERYHAWRIDLIREYGVIVQKMIDVPEENIVDTLRIEIRRARTKEA